MTVRSVMELVLWSLSSSLRGFSVVILAITSHSVSAEYQCHTYPHLWLQHFYMVSSRRFFYCNCDVREMCETRTTEQMSKCGKPRKCSENASKIPEIFLYVISNRYSFIWRLWEMAHGFTLPPFPSMENSFGEKSWSWEVVTISQLSVFLTEWCSWITMFNVQHHELSSSISYEWL